MACPPLHDLQKDSWAVALLKDLVGLLEQIAGPTPRALIISNKCPGLAVATAQGPHFEKPCVLWHSQHSQSENEIEEKAVDTGQYKY